MKLALWIALCLILYCNFGFWKIRRTHKRVAASRLAMTRPELLDRLTASGAAPDVALSITEWASAYLSRDMTLHPDDRIVDDICIDPDDVGDFVSDFYSANAMPQPTRKFPEILPERLSVAMLAQYLTQQRRALLE